MGSMLPYIYIAYMDPMANWLNPTPWRIRPFLMVKTTIGFDQPHASIPMSKQPYSKTLCTSATLAPSAAASLVVRAHTKQCPSWVSWSRLEFATTCIPDYVEILVIGCSAKFDINSCQNSYFFFGLSFCICLFKAKCWYQTISPRETINTDMKIGPTLKNYPKNFFILCLSSAILIWQEAAKAACSVRAPTMEYVLW